ncbi:dihydropteroate synthase [Candidatus Eisenbacteria bacterium]|uniref:Dihydropteroate synthase n=1 Tax=Eiseniibacteriota bacterium TaxID=2212470 RepID=A0ABV6YPT1_UNCEI
MEMHLGGFTLDLNERPLIMGILNVTPDSFYDGGAHAGTEEALRHAREMIADGADLIDVGGESTRPGSDPVSAADEIERIKPVVEHLLEDARVPVSIDTRKADVARAMLAAGAHMINDVSGLKHDTAMAGIVAESGAPLVIMHMRGTSETMQTLTDYDDVVNDVKRELAGQVAAAEAAGVAPGSIIIDPGIGFAKTAGQSVELIARLDELKDLGKPILLGPSRKSFIGKTLGLEPQDRLEATITSCIVGVRKGARILRVHDVKAVSRALRMHEVFAPYERLKERKASD